ncbi:MAG: LysM domain-containing protein [Chloroflexota bacterium]
MSTNIKRISELIWNIVGVLSAILLVLYISTSFLGMPVDKIIPISGGAPPAFEETSPPTAFVVTVQVSATPTEVVFPSEIPASKTASSTPEIPTATNTATATATPDPFPVIIAGYGPEKQFTLHKLQSGESYSYLADLYNTAVVVLESLNFNKEGKRLWEGQYIVILPGQMQLDPSMPQFTVVIFLDSTRLQDVAVNYGTSVEELRFYNLLNSDINEVFMRILLIPVYDQISD